MKDVFYTLLTVWIIWRIYSAFMSNKGDNNEIANKPNEGNVTIKNNKPKQNHIPDEEGEYVDYEEIK